jgi:Arc/MetJ-type ribon-helix-helix transcriptional regulator
MVRMQIQFSEEQTRLLRTEAAREHVSVSEIVRRAVTQWAAGRLDLPAGERRRRAIKAAGRFASGLNDVAAKHDDYLADAYRS